MLWDLTKHTLIYYFLKQIFLQDIAGPIGSAAQAGPDATNNEPRGEFMQNWPFSDTYTEIKSDYNYLR